MTLSLGLTIFVILLLIVDVVYRIKVGRPVPDPNTPPHDGIFKEFFRDYKDQLSFTRLITAIVLLFGFAIVVYGLYHPALWEQCKSTWEKISDLAKFLFGIGKTPEAVSQLQGIVGGKVDSK